MAAVSPVCPTDTLCATAARRRNLSRGGARVRKLTPSPNTPSQYRPVRVIEREVMVSVAEEDEEELAEQPARTRRSPTSRRHQQPRYYLGSPPPVSTSRKVQYCRSPEVHEYTKESSGSYRGQRREWKIQADGTIVDLGTDQAAGVMAAMTGDVMQTPAAAVVCSSPPRESNVITVLEQQTKGGQQQQIIQVVEDCSCFDTEPKPQTPPPPQTKVHTSPCNECLDEMYFYGQPEQARPVSGGAKSPPQVRVLQEATYQETNDDRLKSLQLKQEHIHDIAQDVRYELSPVRTTPRSRESNLGAVAEPAIRIIHEERLIDPNAPVAKEEPLLAHSPKEVTSATAAASPGKEEPKPDFVMDPSIIPVKSLSEVRIIQDFPKFDVPASVRIIPSATSPGGARPSSVKVGQGGSPEAIPVPYEPLHILKEERRFEAVNLIRDSQKSDSQHQLARKERSLESSPEGRRRNASPELGRKLSRTHVHHTLSNRSVAGEDISDDEHRSKRLALVPYGQRGRASRRSSHEAYRARSYERPRDTTSPPSIHIQSRRRPAGLHIALERPEPPRSPSPDKARREKSPLDRARDPKAADRRMIERILSRSPSPFDPKLRPPEVPPIDARSAPMEEVARHAWKQYSREYQRYLSNLAEWNQQQELLRNQLGNFGSGSSGGDSGGSVASQRDDQEEGPVRIRIALSANSRGRSGTPSPSDMSPLSSPRPGSKHTVCTESISLMDTVKGPEPPRCSSHIETNRQRKARAAEEPELEASFEERTDRRVHMTPLCSEHMSYRAFSNNSPATRPPPRSAAKKGTPLSRLLPVMPVTKHYMERIDFPDSPERRQTPPRKDRRQFIYPMLQQMGIPKDFLIYFLVSMATLASIFAVIGVFSKHERSLSEHATQNAPAAVSLSNGSRPLFIGYKRHTKTATRFDVCKSADCQREGRYLTSRLSWAIEPCVDFRAFVCNKPGPAPLMALERSVAREVRRKSPRSEIMPLKHLHDRCMKVGSRKWSQLHAAFALISLDGWPFQDSHDLSHDLVWEAAAALERRLGVSSLLGVSVQPQSKVVVLAKAKAWPQSRDKVMQSHFVKYAKALRPSTKEPEKRAAEVVSFSRKLDALPNHQPRERSRSGASPYSRFVSLLGLGADSDDREVLFSEEMASQLIQEVNDAAPHVVLNYQGLLAAEKMSLLLPGAKVNEETCWRLVRDALPELYLYAAYRDKSSALKDAAKVTESIRNNVVLYVNAASWMEASVRKEAVERLRNLRVLAFVPAWFSDVKRVHDEFGSLPHPSMDNGPLAYVALKEHTHGRQLRGEAWPVPPDSSQCAFDDSLSTLYLPLLAANLTRVQTSPLVLARLPTLGVQLAACMMHVVTAQADQWWGGRSLRKLQPLRKCVDSHGGDALLNQMAALAPAHSVYSSRLRSGAHEYRLQHAENVTAEQMFFVHFAQAQCHGPAQLVNVPLKNYEPFRRAFGCHPGARMSPAKTCRFWAS
ncbi:hypothetical protein V5799_018246 [Amblyomma americanum]|uniref:Uncharacterized protein n=1 Tax=Amblyomma americanum TaxID=6943 RepID=A0AAQ4F0D8_AMBAM